MKTKSKLLLATLTALCSMTMLGACEGNELGTDSGSFVGTGTIMPTYALYVGSNAEHFTFDGGNYSLHSTWRWENVYGINIDYYATRYYDTIISLHVVVTYDEAKMPESTSSSVKSSYPSGTYDFIGSCVTYVVVRY